MNFSQSVNTCFSKYVTFSGRAIRSEYWWFFLFFSLAIWISDFVIDLIVFTPGDEGDLIRSLLSLVVMIIFLIPFAAVSCRRLHDIGVSGWWQFLPFTGIGVIPLYIMTLMRSQPKENRFGPNPLANEN